MNVETLRKQCHEQIAIAGDAATVTLVVPGRWGKRDTKRVWKGGPVGRIVSETVGHGTGRPCVVVMVSAREVLAAVERVTATPEGGT